MHRALAPTGISMNNVNVQALTTGLRLREDGIWYATDDDPVSYPESGHAALVEVEEGSFWFNHRNNAIAALVGAFPPPPGGVMLDVGGGNGYVSVALASHGHDVVVVEPGRTGARNAKERGIDNVVCATTRSANVLPGSVAAIGLFDVIEHIDDDAEFIAHIASLLQKGGTLYATVPAYQLLWSNDDERAGHFRRHSIRSMRDLLTEGGFEIEFITHLFRPLPLPVLLFRSLPYRLRSLAGAKTSRPTAAATANTARSHATGGGVISRFTSTVLAPEIRNIRSASPMRFGGSILVAARHR